MTKPAKPAITCSCCGYVTISDQFDACSICRWVHDPVQEADPLHDNKGPNYVTLQEAQRNYRLFGAASKAHVPDARDPSPDDVRDPNWKPVTVSGQNRPRSGAVS